MGGAESLHRLARQLRAALTQPGEKKFPSWILRGKWELAFGSLSIVAIKSLCDVERKDRDGALTELSLAQVMIGAEGVVYAPISIVPSSGDPGAAIRTYVFGKDFTGHPLLPPHNDADSILNRMLQLLASLEQLRPCPGLGPFPAV